MSHRCILEQSYEKSAIFTRELLTIGHFFKLFHFSEIKMAYGGDAGDETFVIFCFLDLVVC